MSAFLVSLPIFFLVATGFVLKRRAFFSDEFVHGTNAFVYRVSLPALILNSLSDGLPEFRKAKWVILAFSSVTILVLFLAFAYSKWARHDGERAATFIQAAYRGNLAFFGIPVLTSAKGSAPGLEGFLSTAVLVFAPVMILYNVCAVVLFYAMPGERRGYFRALGRIASNPLIVPAIAGILIGEIFAPLPEFVTRTLEMLAAPAAPLALICIGTAMADVRGNLRVGDSLAASVFKLAITPMLAYLIARFTGLSSEGMQILMVFATCPTAAASFVFAREMGGDATLASNAVVLSTLLSPIALTIVLAIFF
jgi:predicted permease